MLERSKQLALLLVFALFLLSGCSAGSRDATGAAAFSPSENLDENWAINNSSSIPQSGAEIASEAHVVVTANFGHELIVDTTFELTSSISALEGLQQVSKVETKYGGAFVQDINNARSQQGGSGQDWFVYVNGIQTKTGAHDYDLHLGDVEHLDLHSWDFRQFIPAIIGDFPEPFLHGYEGDVRPTTIVYENSYKEEASEIITTLTELGVADIWAKGISELSQDEKESNNLVLLGDMNCELIAEINKVWNRMGFFAHFEEGRLIVADGKGKIDYEYTDGAGLIQATQNPWNSKGIGACENVVWMISGTNEAGVKSAANALINQYPDFQYAFAAIVIQGDVTKIPQVTR